MREIPPAERVIEVTGLKRSFGQVQAVRGIDLSVRAGELFAFLGPNGAGKSTTINMLCTLLRPDAGSIAIDGLDVVAQPDAVKQRIGLVFQDSLLDKVLSVRENLQLRASFYMSGRKKVNDAVEQAASAVNAGSFMDRPYGRLSGGQRRRADIARALLNTPRILFMDEPTTGLDPQTRLHVWDTIKELQAVNDLTIFLTTHYMEEAAGSDYAVIVDDGQVATEGTPTQLKERYSAELLRIVPTDEQEFTAALDKFSAAFELDVQKVSQEYVFKLERTRDAIVILKELETLVGSFEVLHGTMDDVFINVTGKEIRA